MLSCDSFINYKLIVINSNIVNTNILALPTKRLATAHAKLAGFWLLQAPRMDP